jgi:hypothetical protein
VSSIGQAAWESLEAGGSHYSHTVAQTMRRLLIALMLASGMLLPIAGAQASSPQPASGTFQVVSAIPTSVQPVGDRCLIELDATFALQGTFGGSFTAHFQIVHLGPCDRAAAETFEAHGIYQGTVESASGSFDFNFQGSIDAEGHAQGQLVIQPGTGGLANLQGMLTLTGQAGVGGTYVGDIHFDP